MVTQRTNQVAPIEGRGSMAAVAVLLCGLVGLPQASGQDSGSVTVDVGECVELKSPEDRFACYEAQVDAALSVTIDVGECVELKSAEARLACYEAQVDEALEERGAAESGDRVAVTQDRGIAEDPSRERDAARSAEQAAIEQAAIERYIAEQAREAEAADEYFGTITALHERLPNSYVITLDNGQIWEQSAPKRYPLIRGLEVRIYPSNWGPSHRLTGVDLSGHIQVRQVR